MSSAIIFIGRVASGKSSYAKKLSSHFQIPIISFGSFLILCCKNKGIPISRENLQAEGEEWIKQKPEQFVENVIKLTASNVENIIFDGVRHNSILQIIRNKYSKCLLVFIDIKDDVRYDRYISRARLGDDSISFENFKAIDSHSTEIEIDLLKNNADYIITDKLSFEENIKILVDIFNKFL